MPPPLSPKKKGFRRSQSESKQILFGWPSGDAGSIILRHCITPHRTIGEVIGPMLIATARIENVTADRQGLRHAVIDILLIAEKRLIAFQKLAIASPVSGMALRQDERSVSVPGQYMLDSFASHRCRDKWSNFSGVLHVSLWHLLLLCQKQL